MTHTKRVMPELSSGAMADIAFLLLTFYMVTTEIKEYKGLNMMLPQYQTDPVLLHRHDRNIFTIVINSSDQIMIEGKAVENLNGIRDRIKKFVMNYKKDPAWSDSPAEAVVSIKTDRGTTYRSFVAALDEAQAAYYEIYADRAGMTPAEFRSLDRVTAENKKTYDKARQGIPMNISIAEPSVNIRR